MIDLLDQGAAAIVAAIRSGKTSARAAAQFLTEYDYLLTPTTACVSWPVERVYPKTIGNREVGPQIVPQRLPLLAMAQRAEMALA